MTKFAPIRKAMIIIILLLYIFTTIEYGVEITFKHSIFVNNAQSIVTKYLFSIKPGQSGIVVMDTMSIICSVLANATMVHVTSQELSFQLTIVCRFGVVGLCGDSTGFLFCFQFFFSSVQ